MYTPRRRSSVSESTYRFTPSKRGQAALDALALGYDVQLPDYSLALLPRSATSEQALATIISTSASPSVEQLPRSTSYGEPSHRVALGSGQGSGQRYPSELADRRRFARHGRSPRGENILYSTSNTGSPPVPLVTRVESPSSVVDSRPSTSSLQSSTPQCVLTSPERDAIAPGPIHLEQPPISLATLHTPRSLPRSPAQSGFARRHSLSRNKPSPPRLSIETPSQSTGANPTFTYSLNERNPGDPQSQSRLSHSRNSSPHTSPVKPVAPPLGTFHNRAFNHAARAPPPLRIDVEQLGRSTKEGPHSAYEPHYLRSLSRPSPLFPIQPSPERDNKDTYRALQQISRGPVHYRHSISSAHPSSSYHTSRLPTIDEPRYIGAQPQFQPSSQDLSDPRRYDDHSRRHHIGAPLRPSSPSQVSATSSLGKAPTKPSHHAQTQSLNNFVPSSRNSVSPHTPSSSLPSSHNMDPDDEAFRVHPERAAISRMESLLMLSACRYEAEGRWSAGGTRSATGFEAAGFPNTQAGFPGGMNGPNATTAHAGVSYLAYGAHGQEQSERSARTPSDGPHQFRPQAGPGSPVYPRTPGGTRGRQRSGSMHVLSPHRHGPSRNGSPPRQRQSHMQSPQRMRPRQRSWSLTVQGLSPEAVKKLRVYETIKGREGGRVESLREMVGVGLPVVKRQQTKTKRNGGSSQGSKATLSPTEVSTPIDPSPIESQMETVSTPDLSVGIPAPPSPTSVPLPPSPILLPPLSPTQVALPPSPVHSPTRALPFASPSTVKEPAPTVSPLVSSESFMKYRVSQGIESPRPMRTRQDTVSGRVVPTFRLISSPEKGDQLVLGPRLDLAGGAEVGLGAPHNLKPDPAIERILTPPPSFWSPPPLSAVVRTSAPLLTITGPVRAMSVPPGAGAGAGAGAGDTQLDDVRRAWSCEPPVGVEVRVGKSFAGDWSQCMVIDVSDEEEEGDLVTDASPSEDESELEDEGEDEVGRNGWGGASGPKDLADSRAAECLRDVVEVPERDEVERDLRDTMDYPRRGASKYYISGGSSGSGSASGVNAVEAVQNVIVKLAMDNAELGHAQRMQEMQNKFSTKPLSAGLVPRYPVHPQLQLKQPLEYPQYFRTSQMQASINAYFDPPTTHTLRSKSQMQQPTYPKSNPALDSLRSGLEKRVAASASAVEEAVRARSASPSLPPPITRSGSTRSVSNPVLPPRLQRLQAARAWTAPKIALSHSSPAFRFSCVIADVVATVEIPAAETSGIAEGQHYQTSTTNSESRESRPTVPLIEPRALDSYTRRYEERQTSTLA
ncbi:hypothetical protein FRC12_022460 [Ceratobasidium sp. 428]|nr:hypothetical protein FRC12_022460 [Ceratobasidium sp. 428]